MKAQTELTDNEISYPKVLPVPEGITRPFFSVMVPTCNRREFLERTLQSVMDNDLGPDLMQIEVVDNSTIDCGIEDLVKRLGKGRINYFKQPFHVGMSENWTTCVQRSIGYWVHILHDDDMILPEFFKVYFKFIKEHSEVVMVSNRAIVIDMDDKWLYLWNPVNELHEGILENAVYNLCRSNFIAASSVVTLRDVYERIGCFSSELYYCSDWHMWIRIANYGKIGYLMQPRLMYRAHQNSETTNQFQIGNSVTEVLYTFNMGLNSLPEDMHKVLKKNAYRDLSNTYISFSNNYLTNGDSQNASFYAIWAIKLNPSIRSFTSLFKILPSIVSIALFNKKSVNSKFP